MNTITLTEAQIKQLEAAILEIPGKFSIPLIQLINGLIQENAPKPTPVEEDKVTGP